MAVTISVSTYTSFAHRALPYAPPDVSAEFLLAQLPFLDEEVGIVLAERLIDFIPAGSWAWQLSDEVLDRWPAAVAGFVMARVRAIPPGPTRIEALCQVPRRLTAAERRQALDGLLGGQEVLGVGPFVRSLPDAWKEEWLARELARPLDPSADADAAVAGIEREVRARNAAGLWPEDAESALQRRIEALPPGKGAGLAGLPWRPDPPAPRLDDLSVEERVALVRNPKDPRQLKTEDGIADHLEWLARNPVTVSLGEWQRWLSITRHFRDVRARTRAMIALAPVLDETHRKEALSRAAETALRMADWPCSPARWDLLPDRDRPWVARGLVRQDKDGRKVDDLIDYARRELPVEEGDKCLDHIFHEAFQVRHDRCLATLTGLTPWLAERTGGLFQRKLVIRGGFYPPHKPPRRDERTMRRLGKLPSPP